MNFMRIFNFMESIVDSVMAYPDTQQDMNDFQMQTSLFLFI